AGLVCRSESGLRRVTNHAVRNAVISITTVVRRSRVGPNRVVHTVGRDRILVTASGSVESSVQQSSANQLRDVAVATARRRQVGDFSRSNRSNRRHGRGLVCSLTGSQQARDSDRRNDKNNRNHDQKFQQRKTFVVSSHLSSVDLWLRSANAPKALSD